MPKLRTTIQISSGHAEYETEIEVDYTVHRGCRATYTQPGEEDTAEIASIKVLNTDGSWWAAPFLGDLLQNDDEILADCMQDWIEREIYAEEQRAEIRREDLQAEYWDSSL